MQPLLGGPRADLDEDLLREALSLKFGATTRYGLAVTDLAGKPLDVRLRWSQWTATWAYRPQSETAGQDSGVTATRRRLDATLIGPPPVNLNAVRLQPWTEMLLRDGSWARFDHGVFEPQNPGIADDGVLITRQLTCVDKSGRWAAGTLGQPIVVAGDEPIVAYVKASLAAQFGETDCAIASSDATLGEARTFEASTNWADFYDQLLEGIGYDQLTADEQGRPASDSMSALANRGPEIAYGAGQGKVLTAGQVEPLLPTLPNVLRFSARQGPSLGNEIGNGLTERRNETTGPASLAARGGYEVRQTIDVQVDTQEALEAVANAEAQRYFAGGGLRWQGKVGLNPLHGERDVIGLELPRLGLQSDAWLVTQWSLRGSPEVTETVALMDVWAEARVA